MIDHLALSINSLQNLEGSAAGVANNAENLIAQARRGDQAAFGLLFERHARLVLSFLFNQIGRREVAEELTQETFVRAYRCLPEFREQAKFSTWLLGIAKNVAREWSRSKEGRTPQQSNEIEPGTHPTSPGSPADDLLSKELNFILEAALQTLDEGRREVFVLKVFQQRTYQEIVDITGFSLAKVKIELHRARAEMRRHMQPYLET
jgi:RNA polymerase sigma-70 factor (ECF subfamily)